jgi:hypothetical protein
VARQKSRRAGAVLSALAVLAAAAPVAAADEDEDCIFDQAAQLEHYRDMERRIPGARYDAADGALVIARGAARITVRRGGCVHFGLMITHAAPLAAGDADRDAVFARAVALVAEFGGGELVTAEEVAAAIRDEAFALAQEGFYYLALPGVNAFSIMWGVEDGRLTVEVAYYIN